MSTSGTVPVTAHLLRTMPPPRDDDGGKAGRGRVLVVGGGVEVPGAVLLAATAALRVGAGKLQIATCRDVATALAVAIPEALVAGLPQTPDGHIAAEAGASLAERAARNDAVLVGPGMMGGDAAALTAAILRGAPDAGAVLDAGALPALGEHPDLFRGRREPAVITPHIGEMGRLLERDTGAVEADPLACAREAAERFGVVTVLKGSATHIAAPDGQAWCYDAGHVGLATSGSGDTLAGLVAGLAARGCGPVEAALWGVFLHGEAGRRLARTCGGLGFLAREIPPEVPRLMGEVLA